MAQEIDPRHVCALCGEYKQSTEIEICQLCENDARLLGQDAKRFAPTAAERVEMMRGYRGDGR